MSIVTRAGGRQLKVMEFLGILPNGHGPLRQHVRFAFYSSILISFGYSLVLKQYKLEKFEREVVSCCITGTVLLAMARLFVYRIKIKKIEDLFDDLNETSSTTDHSKRFHPYQKTIKLAKVVTKLATILYSSILVVGMLQPLIFWRMEIPTDSWYMHDHSRSLKTWAIEYIYEIICSCSVTITAFLVDTLPFIIMVIIKGQIEELGTQLESLTRHLEPHSLNQSLEVCMKKYIKIVRVCRQFENVFSTINFFNIGILCFNLCSSAIALNLLTHADFATGIFVSSSICFEIFVPFFLGNSITSSSEALKFQLYSSNWTSNISTQSNKGLFIFMEVLKQPIKITFGNIFILDLETFTKISNIVFRLYSIAGYFIERSDK